MLTDENVVEDWVEKGGERTTPALNLSEEPESEDELLRLRALNTLCSDIREEMLHDILMVTINNLQLFNYKISIWKNLDLRKFLKRKYFWNFYKIILGSFWWW